MIIVNKNIKLIDLLQQKAYSLYETVIGITNKSKSEVRRLFEQKAIKVNGITIDNIDTYGLDGDIIQIGKRIFRKIKL